MADPAVLAIVVAHPSRTRIAETLRSLSEQNYGAIGVVVVAVGDINIAEDASYTVVRVPEGVGFAAAATRALSLVESEGFPYVLLLHDDVSLEPDAVGLMVAASASDPAIAAVGAKLVEWYEPTVLQEVGAAIDRFAIRRSPLDVGEVDHGQRDGTSDVLFCSDACLLVRSDALLAVGGLDAHAWPFYEDVDLCWRLRAGGSRVVVEPAARVRHAADLSSGRRLIESVALREHAEHGRLRFMLKHYAPIGLAVLLPQLVLAALARLVNAVVRRELWRARVILGAWSRTARELPGIARERRRAPKARVEDRELLALAARGAAGDVRGERAEWMSRMFAGVGRLGDRAVALAGQSVTWATAAAAVVLLILLRKVLFGGTFALGELRELSTFGDAVSNHVGRVAREGLDPFGPSGPGLIVFGLVRSVLMRAPLSEKVVLLLPVWLSGMAGARWADSLGFSATARRWLAIGAAVNPVTLSLLRDGSVGALVAWAASIWLASQILTPSAIGTGAQARMRFTARWAFAWGVAISLHPPALLLLLALGGVIVVARRGAEETDRTGARLQIVGTGAAGAFVLLLPWSAELLTLRSPLVGRPGWLVNAVGGGLFRASLGAGWPLIGWLVVALAAAFFVGLDRTSFALAAFAAMCVLAGASGAFPRETMLVGAGVSAFLILSIVARHILDELPRYELGSRQAAVIAGVTALAVLWVGGVALTVPGGVRARDVPIIAGVRPQETGRVLWLSETSGGVRAWTTLSFSEQLGVFPPPAGPEDRLITKAIEAARAGGTHRLGGILALADISHVVALDDQSKRGLSAQADIGPQEEQGTSTIYRNDAWRGPIVLLSSPPDAPLSPGGLADAVRDTRRVATSGWPYGPVTIRTRSTGPARRAGVPASAVVYVAAGHRGGLRISGASGRIAAAGAYVPAADVLGRDVAVGLPGRWWRWMLPLQALIVVASLGAWLTAAYMGAPLSAPLGAAPELRPLSLPPFAAGAVPAVLVAAVLLGWSGLSWGTGAPFLSSAWYCPPVGAGYRQSIAIANPNNEPVEYLLRPSLAGRPLVSRRIGPRARHTLSVDASAGAVVESYGRRLVVATEVSRQGSYDASLCASDTQRLNIFPEGGRGATKAIPRLFERYILYNPFPDLARASVRFVATNETIAPPPLQDVHVEPGHAVIVDPEEQFEPMLDLSTTVRVWQGRAIVARRLRTVEQVSWSLPVPAGSGGVVPRAVTQDAASDLIVVNLSEDPSHLTVSGAGRTGSLPQEMFDVAGSRRTDFELGDVEPRAKNLVVSVKADREVAIESLVAPDDRKTVSLLPLLHAQRRWAAPIAEGRYLLVQNPGTRRARVEFTRLGRGPAIAPMTIEANRVVRVVVPGRMPSAFVVASSGGGVTVAAVGKTGTIPGVPL